MGLLDVQLLSREAKVHSWLWTYDGGHKNFFRLLDQKKLLRASLKKGKGLALAIIFPRNFLLESLGFEIDREKKS